MPSKSSAKSPPFPFSNKYRLLIYSLFFGFGSVSLFVAVTGFNTAYLAMIWKYSDSYILNATFITLVSLLSAVIFFLSCWYMVRESSFSKYIGLIAGGILILYPIYILFQGTAMPISFDYLTILIIPAVVLLVLIIILWKKLP
jgi:hypothetical protein